MAAVATQITGHILTGVLSLPAKPPPSTVPARQEAQSHGATEVHDHKTLEADIKEDWKEYHEKREAGKPIPDLNKILDNLIEDTQGCIHSREEENRLLGDTNGPTQHENHEKRIQVLDANISLYRLEKQHLAELARNGKSSAWNVKTNSWGPLRGEFFPPPHDDGGEKDMDLSD